jgi:ABC-2 type transport system ATP-binding protein
MVQRGPAIEMVALVKRYGSIAALDGLTMSVPRGEIFGFLGPNGAGKTTAVKLLLGLSRPTSGEGAVLGAPFGDLETRRHIGYLPELFRYQDWLTAREVLDLHCKLLGLARDERTREIAEALDAVSLAARADDRVGGFSKGMQQRLGLGVALLGQPDLVILDEPTSALDPVGRYDVREIIVAIKQRGATVFLNSHLLTEVEKVCDRVAIVDQGRIVELGALEELLHGDVVRLRLAPPVPTGLETLIAQFGQAVHKDGWITIRGMDLERIPDLVERLVRNSARVQAVEQSRSTLEERFLEVLDEDS